MRVKSLNSSQSALPAAPSNRATKAVRNSGWPANRFQTCTSALARNVEYATQSRLMKSSPQKQCMPASEQLQPECSSAGPLHHCSKLCGQQITDSAGMTMNRTVTPRASLILWAVRCSIVMNSIVAGLTFNPAMSRPPCPVRSRRRSPGRGRDPTGHLAGAFVLDQTEAKSSRRSIPN
jgi:hypothetical protein